MNMVHAHATATLVCDRLVAAAALVVQRGMVVPDASGAGSQLGEQPQSAVARWDWRNHGWPIQRTGPAQGRAADLAMGSGADGAPRRVSRPPWPACPAAGAGRRRDASRHGGGGRRNRSQLPHRERPDLDGVTQQCSPVRGGLSMSSSWSTRARIPAAPEVDALKVERHTTLSDGRAT